MRLLLFVFRNGFHLPDDSILDLSKMKAFAGYSLSFTQNMKVVYHRVENILRKGEKMLVTSIFLFFPWKAFFLGVNKSCYSVIKGLCFKYFYAMEILYNPFPNEKF